MVLFFRRGVKIDESLGAAPGSMIRPKIQALLQAAGLHTQSGERKEIPGKE